MSYPGADRMDRDVGPKAADLLLILGGKGYDAAEVRNGNCVWDRDLRHTRRNRRYGRVPV